MPSLEFKLRCFLAFPLGTWFFRFVSFKTQSKMAAYSEVKKELLEQESKWLQLILLLNKRKEKLKDVPGFWKYSKK